MRLRWLGISLLLLVPLSVRAQSMISPTPAAYSGEPMREMSSYDTPERPRFRAEADYLLWFLKPDRLSTPVLVTVRNPNEDLSATFAAGGLADPNTVALFGPGSINRGPYSGLHLNFAYEIGDDGGAAVELGGFWLPGQGNVYHYASNASGSPALALPFFDPTTAIGGPGETGGGFAAPNFGGAPLVGHVDIRTATQLWGADANLAYELFCNNGWRLQGLGGFRYLGLNDLFQETAVLQNSFGGQTYDRFATANNFYGGQLGLRLVGDLGRFQPSLTTKVAPAALQETLNIAGSAILPTNAVVPAGMQQLPGVSTPPPATSETPPRAALPSSARRTFPSL